MLKIQYLCKVMPPSLAN